MKYININEINNIDNPILIDVRIPSIYMMNHINGFINIPLGRILTIKDKYSKDSNIVLYCDHGNLSKKGANILNSIGYKNLYIVLNNTNLE